MMIGKMNGKRGGDVLFFRIISASVDASFIVVFHLHSITFFSFYLK